MPDNSPVWDQRAQPEVLGNRFFFQDNARGMGPADLALAIRRGERPRMSKEMACHALEVFEALYESSRSRKWMEVCSVFEQPRPMPCADDVDGETECFV